MSEDLHEADEGRGENQRPPVRSDHELMGPILRRKKVVSMPIGMGGKKLHF